jgi:hypothetical protein
VAGDRGLRPERFADETALTRFLHHELAHLADMVNPDFGYSPELGQTGQTPSQLRLTRERYRLLWDVSIDGRLAQRGLETVADEVQRRQEFNRGFAFLPDERRDELFEALWHGQLAQHRPLLELAADPRGCRGVMPRCPAPPVPSAALPPFNGRKSIGCELPLASGCVPSFPAGTTENPFAPGAPKCTTGSPASNTPPRLCFDINSFRRQIDPLRISVTETVLARTLRVH